MTKITDILDYDLLLKEVEAGYVRLQIHPDYPMLYIANYTDQCAFDRHWNDVTMKTRGLIWNDKTLEVLARPFQKFFNWDEKEAPRILDDQVVWSYSNKYDGSLGILYIRPDGKPAVATRGSFASDQANMATAYITRNPGVIEDDLAHLAEGYTPLYEICGPENRIVLTYDEFFLARLGYIHIETGVYMPHWIAAYHHEPRTMRSLLADLSRDKAEGWVVWLSNTKPLKIKQADYIELHRIVSNLSVKEIWRQLRAGTYFDFVTKLPDEWHDWARGHADRLREQFVSLYNQAEIQYKIVSRMQSVGGEPYSRKAQAGYIIGNLKPELRGLVFSLLDGRDITDAIWRLLEPKGNDTE